MVSHLGVKIDPVRGGVGDPSLGSPLSTPLSMPPIPVDTHPIQLYYLTVPPPMDDPRVIRSLDVSDPGYQGLLTDAQAEVDLHLRAISTLCDQYKLAHFLLICQPRGAERVVYQSVGRAYDNDSPLTLWQGIDMQVRTMSGGRMALVRVVDVTEDETDEKGSPL